MALIVAAADGIEIAAELLEAGQVVALPTDTVYGVAVDPLVPGATERLFAAKRRPHDVALPVLVGSTGDAMMLARPISDDAQRLMTSWWPGPLTIVLTRNELWREVDLGGDPATVGIRCPDFALVQLLARRVGPLATSSANRHGASTPPDAQGVATELGDDVGVVLDGGACRGKPSTVVDATGDVVLLLREGAIPWSEVVASLRG